MPQLKNLFLILPVMIYYFIESLLSGFVIMLVYNHMLYQLIGFDINYRQWVCLIWIVKVIFFDVFKFNQQHKDDSNDSDNNTNNINTNNLNLT